MRGMFFKAQNCQVRARYLIHDTPAGCKGLPIKHHTVLIASNFFLRKNVFISIINHMLVSSSFVLLLALGEVTLLGVKYDL